MCHYNDRHDYFMSQLPYGILSMGAYLEKKGHDVTVANFSSRGQRGALKYIQANLPDILGVSLFSFNRVDTLKLIKTVKKKYPGVRIVAGGPHATFLAEQILSRYPEIDHIICGEGEQALDNLVRDISAGRKPPVIIQGDRITNIDEMPPVSGFRGAMIGVNPNEQFKFIVTTRGCPNRCTFCSSPAFWKRRVSYRSAEDIYSEIRDLNKKYGIIYFAFRDDNFTLKKDRVIKLSQMLQKSGMYIMWNCQARVDTVDEDMLVEMKRAGLEHIQYGVESGSERILASYDKGADIDDIVRASEITRRVGVYLSIYLMAGMAGETGRDIRKTLALIRRILPGDGMVSPVALYPGTALYEKLKAGGEVSDDIWFKSRDAGIFLRHDPAVGEWVRELVNELGIIRERSWYREKDFQGHRKICGSGCWVTDILEGDYYLDEELFESAGSMYEGVTGMYPENPWGHMRMGKLRFLTGDFESSASHYESVTRIVPAFYGGWLKSAEAHMACGRKKEAAAGIREAHKRNSRDARVRNLMKILKA